MHSDIQKKLNAPSATMAIRVMLVDDESVARLGVRVRLRKHHDFEIVSEVASAKEAIRDIRQLRPDAVFLDVKMVGLSGLDIARMLEGDQKPLVIFLTAHPQYALKAFDVEATDYLLKPLDDLRFEKTLDRIREAVRIARSRGAQNAGTSAAGLLLGRIAVPNGKKTLFLDVIAIDWVSAAGDYSKLHVHGRSYLLREPLSSLVKRLPRDVFLRIHRSTVVNLQRVSDFIQMRNQDLLVTLKDGSVLRCSRTYSDEFRNILLQR